MLMRCLGVRLTPSVRLLRRPKRIPRGALRLLSHV